MRKISIVLTSLGNLKRPINYRYITQWKSKLFKIHTLKNVAHLGDSDGADWEYTKDALSRFLSADKAADLTIGIIAHPIENNYYMHRISKNTAVISIYEMDSIIKAGGFKIEDFIIRNIYELVVLYVANKSLLLSHDCTWVHDDIRGCLFDMNPDKEDILLSLDKPILCEQCKARIFKCDIEQDFVTTLENELKKIKICLFSRILLFVKENPKWSITIAVVSTIVINIASSYLYELLKKTIEQK